jgi:hypothetical protein
MLPRPEWGGDMPAGLSVRVLRPKAEPAKMNARRRLAPIVRALRWCCAEGTIGPDELPA